MSAAGLIAIKRRIKSITNTRKITKAMGLVSTAKLRKVRVQLNTNDGYYKAFTDVAKEIFENYEKESIYTYGNSNRKKLYIVFTSEMGLCGGFNLNVVNKSIEAVKSDKANSILIVIGQKGKNYCNRLRYETAAEYVEVPDSPSFKEAKIIAQHALRLFRNNEVGEVYTVFTRFFSAVKQSVEVEKILPVPFKSNYSFNDYVIFEPALDEMVDDIVDLYLNEQILFFMLNSKCSEHSSRMNTMEGATKNANDLLVKLNLKYNRIRQSAITQELSEIIGGAEAQK